MSKHNGFGDIVAEDSKDLIDVPDDETPVEDVRTVHVGGYFPKPVHTQLKIMCIEQDKELRHLLAEAFNLVFDRYNKPPIA